MPLFAQQTPPADDIYDIVVLAPKDPVWPIYLAIGLLVLLLIAIGFFVWWWLRRSKRNKAVSSPEHRAIDRLRDLKQKHETLDPNKFTLAVSETIKDYLAAKFDDPVRYETTQEFLNRVSKERSKLPDAAQQQLQQFLATTEELKFGNAMDAGTRTAPLIGAAARIVELCQAIGNDAEASR